MGVGSGMIGRMINSKKWENGKQGRIMFFLFSIFFTTCAKTIFDIEKEYSEKYPDKKFIVGVASGRCDEPDKILSKAKAEISKKIRVHIKTISSGVEEVRKEGRENYLSGWFKAESIEESSIELVGVKSVASGKLKGNECYQVAVVEKREIANFYQEKLFDVETSIRKFLAEADEIKEKQKGSIKELLINLFKALEMSEKAIVMRDILIGIGERWGKAALAEKELSEGVREKKITPSQIKNEIYSIFKEINIERVGEQIVEGRRGRTSIPLYVKVSSKFSVPIHFAVKKGKAEITETVYSENVNGENISKGEVLEIKEVEGRSIVVEAYLDPKDFIPSDIPIDADKFSRDLSDIISDKKVLWTIKLPDEVQNIEKIFYDALTKIGVSSASIGDFTTSDGFSSQFSVYIKEKIENVLSSYGVIEKFPSENIIEGIYWNFPQYVELTIKLKRGGKIEKSTTLKIPKDVLPPLSFEIKGLKYKEILSDEKEEESFIEVWTDKGKSPVYKVGENLTVYVRVKKDSLLRILYFTTDGKIVKIFPNEYSGERIFRAGVVYKIPDESMPFKFEVTPPEGVEVLKVMAVAVENVPEKELAGLRDVKEEDISTEPKKTVELSRKNLIERGRLLTARGVAVKPDEKTKKREEKEKIYKEEKEKIYSEADLKITIVK